MKKIIIASCAALLLAALPAFADVDMTRYLALGDSLTAGFASGGLTQYYQERSYPAMLAGVAGAPDFQLPLVSAPGIPPLMELQSLVPTVIAAPAVAPGQPINATLARPYNNLGVPGANLYDLLFTTGDIMNLLAGNTDNVMHDLILRDGVHPAIEQGIGLNPTFVTMWIGNNDELGAAIYATPIEGVTMTPVANFQTMYGNALGALVTYLPGVDIVVINLPDVTSIPFVTTIAPYVNVPGMGHVPLIGSNGPLPEDAYVTLYASSLLAQGIGIPVALGGTGQPLPEDVQIIGTDVVPGVVLRAEEVDAINERIDAFNGIIAATAGALGVPVLDINGYFADVAAGELPTFGGIELDTGFLSGGIFSYDGVHPQNVGYALVAMELVDLINEEFDADIPQVNMSLVLCANGCGGEAAPAGGFNKDAVFGKDAMQSLMKAFPLLSRPSHLEERAESVMY